MPDPLINERLELILDHAKKNQSRLQNITNAGYFISSEAGELLYDSLITRLQAMGENLKKIDQLNSKFISVRESSFHYVLWLRSIYNSALLRAQASAWLKAFEPGHASTKGETHRHSFAKTRITFHGTSPSRRERA